MPATTFTHFPDLASELRSIIWNHAIGTQINDITARLPGWCTGASAERRRQALVGHHTLSPRRTPQYLHLRLRDPYDGRKMCLEEDDFETLVHSLPLAAVCREARVHAAEVCRAWDLAPQMVFHYDTGKLWSLSPPLDGEDEVLLRDIHCVRGAEESLEHVFARPTTLRVFGGRARFRSPEHLVGLISRFFGDRIERLILELWINAGESRARPYWVNSTEPAIVDMNIVLPEERGQDLSTIQVMRDGRLYLAKTTREAKGWKVFDVATHLMKCYEILDASSESLPNLKYIDLNLEVQGLDTAREQIKSIYEDGIFLSRV